MLNLPEAPKVPNVPKFWFGGFAIFGRFSTFGCGNTAWRFIPMAGSQSQKSLPQNLDLTPYAGRWVALVRGCVTGVGANEQAARLASKHQRPKEEPLVVFVPEELVKDGG